jgi:hypothetical protein
MDSSGKTNFEQKLEKLLSADTTDVEAAIDSLDEENEGVRNLPDTVVYDNVPSRVEDVEGAKQDLVDDYKFARKTLYGLIDRGTVALERALVIAKESEHPRAIEVSSSLMKNISDITKDLLELHKALNPQGSKTIKIDTVNATQNNSTTNNYNGENIENDPGAISNLLDQLDFDAIEDAEYVEETKE